MPQTDADLPDLDQEHDPSGGAIIALAVVWAVLVACAIAGLIWSVL